MKYEIVKYDPEFRSQILELQKHLWGPDEALNAAYLQWKHDRNPYLNRPLIFLALCERKVVGMCAMFGAQWQAGSPLKTFIVPCPADGVVAPDHRKQGLFGRMLIAALDDLSKNGYSYNFALSANASSYVKLTNLGWRDLGSLQEMRWKDEKRNTPAIGSRFMKRLRLPKFLDFSSSSVSDEIHSPFHFLDKNSVGRRHKVNRYVSVEQAPRPAAMADLIQRMGTDGHMQQVRDQQFFTWRFQNPRSEYRFLFWEDAKLEGYLILRASVNKEITLVQIVDWEAITSNARADLLHAAIRWGSFHHLTIWSATLPQDSKRLLQDSGFQLKAESKSITDYSPSLLVRSVRKELPASDWVVANRSLLELKNWDLRMIYSDGN